MGTRRTTSAILQHGHVNSALRALCFVPTSLLLRYSIVKANGGFQSVLSRCFAVGTRDCAFSAQVGISAVRISPRVSNPVASCHGTMLDHVVARAAEVKPPASQLNGAARAVPGPVMSLPCTVPPHPFSMAAFPDRAASFQRRTHCSVGQDPGACWPLRVAADLSVHRRRPIRQACRVERHCRWLEPGRVCRDDSAGMTVCAFLAANSPSPLRQVPKITKQLEKSSDEGGG